jgi:ketosteroid isomerase-like protein
MRTVISAFVATLFMGQAAWLRAAEAKDETTQLIALDRAKQRAVVDRDAKKFADFLTDDYILVTSSGKMYKKSDVVADITTPDYRFELNESSDWVVRVAGDTALVIASLHQKGTDHGKAFDYRVRYTDTWIRKKGVWRNISAHACRLP